MWAIARGIKMNKKYFGDRVYRIIKDANHEYQVQEKGLYDPDSLWTVFWTSNAEDPARMMYDKLVRAQTLVEVLT